MRHEQAIIDHIDRADIAVARQKAITVVHTSLDLGAADSAAVIRDHREEVIRELFRQVFYRAVQRTVPYIMQTWRGALPSIDFSELRGLAREKSRRLSPDLFA